MGTHFKPTETFQYTHFDSCHPPGVRKGFIRGEALRLLTTISSKAKFDEHIPLFKQRLQHRGYPYNLLNMTLSEVNSAKECRLYKINKKRAKECCRLLQNTAHQCLISNIFSWANGILYKTDPHYEKYSNTLPLFHVEKGGLWKMYESEQNSEVSEFPILTNRSRVWPVFAL